MALLLLLLLRSLLRTRAVTAVTLRIEAARQVDVDVAARAEKLVAPPGQR